MFCRAIDYATMEWHPHLAPIPSARIDTSDQALGIQRDLEARIDARSAQPDCRTHFRHGDWDDESYSDKKDRHWVEAGLPPL